MRLSDQNTFNNTLKDKSKALDEYMDKYNQMKQALEEERQKISENIKDETAKNETILERK